MTEPVAYYGLIALGSTGVTAVWLWMRSQLANQQNELQAQRDHFQARADECEEDRAAINRRLGAAEAVLEMLENCQMKTKGMCPYGKASERVHDEAVPYKTKLPPAAA